MENLTPPPLCPKHQNQWSLYLAWVMKSESRRPIAMCKISLRSDKGFLLPEPTSPANDVVSRKNMPFEGPENKIFQIDHISLQKWTFLATFWRSKFSLKKALIMVILICKLPLIVIVAPWKLYSERQIGVWNSNMGPSTTPYYRSRNSAKFWIKNRLKKVLTMATLPCKLPLIVIVYPRKLHNEKTNRGRVIQIGDHRWPPIYRSWRSTLPTFRILEPLHISGTVEARNFKFGKPIEQEGQ